MQHRDILDDLEDLIDQATRERSHYYVKSVAVKAMDEIKQLREPRQWDYESWVRWGARNGKLVMGGD